MDFAAEFVPKCQTGQRKVKNKWKKSPKIEPTADAWCQLTRARCCRYESGVHRVQRVPSTESKGRVHTSTASVVVMPEPTEVDRHINDSDLRIGARALQRHSGTAAAAALTALTLRAVSQRYSVPAALADSTSTRRRAQSASHTSPQASPLRSRMSVHSTRTKARRSR